MQEGDRDTDHYRYHEHGDPGKANPHVLPIDPDVPWQMAEPRQPPGPCQHAHKDNQNPIPTHSGPKSRPSEAPYTPEVQPAERPAGRSPSQRSLSGQAVAGTSETKTWFPKPLQRYWPGGVWPFGPGVCRGGLSPLMGGRGIRTALDGIAMPRRGAAIWRVSVCWGGDGGLDAAYEPFEPSCQLRLANPEFFAGGRRSAGERQPDPAQFVAQLPLRTSSRSWRIIVPIHITLTGSCSRARTPVSGVVVFWLGPRPGMSFADAWVDSGSRFSLIALSLHIRSATWSGLAGGQRQRLAQVLLTDQHCVAFSLERLDAAEVSLAAGHPVGHETEHGAPEGAR
jgi:hypothetical protein